MARAWDIQIAGVSLYFIPIQTRVPLKFGTETLTSVTCARVRLAVRNNSGEIDHGWGETPLSVQWVWPGKLSYETRHNAMQAFCVELARSWSKFGDRGHALEIGFDFLENVLPGLLQAFNRGRNDSEQMPWLAALVCCSPFDIALHDAYGIVNRIPIYQTYAEQFLSRDLNEFLTPAKDSNVSFTGQYPVSYLRKAPMNHLPAWHLVGGLDPLQSSDLSGSQPSDGHPVLLREWIERDGLQCLKIKLRGNDATWDYQRVVGVAAIAIESGVRWLSADFNCTVRDPGYVIEILDRLMNESPRAYGMLLYVEQPFPYELEEHRIDVHGVSARKPLFLDESAHDWCMIKLGRCLGWTGVALKTCKTQTGALLSLCWARAHGMTLMVQDLTNPMLAQIPHLLLAAHAPTIMGVETNSMQFYPDASANEAKVHPGVYQRRQGKVDLSSIAGPGFGYRVSEIERVLPPAAVEF
jgi:L-alanine-DL-glutamate epimerase-like enolase superfamily enzyme